MDRTTTLFLLLFIFLYNPSLGDTYPEVLFDNGVMDGNYAYSEVSYEGMSWIENIQDRLPISDSIFFTPGNALSLKYTAAQQGNWRARISYPKHALRYGVKNSDALAIKIFVLSDTDVSLLPKLSIVHGDTLSLPIDLNAYISNYQTNMWVNVNIPLKDIHDLDEGALISGVIFSQGRSDNKTHQLYIDQIEFLPINPPKAQLSSPAILSGAKAYDRHVDITWQLPLTPSIRYIKIYRSVDNENFEPVGVQPVFIQKYTDFVPQSNTTYYYKIAWVDYDYLESPFSDVLQAETKVASDDELLDFIQAAHVNYFVERVEINSGMHAVGFGVDDAIVSVKQTGLSILSQIVGVERGFISRNMVINRMNRILDFLENAQQYHGIFPALLDGRTGRGVFLNDSLPEVDVEATAFLMQGLLVAKQYFHQDADGATPLTEKITNVWQQVAWNKLTIAGQETILYDTWSPVEGFKNARPLGGFNTGVVSYMLAMASPQHALPKDAYRNGLGVGRELIDSTHVMELVENKSFSVTLDENEPLAPVFAEFPYKSDTTLYGLHIDVGSIDSSLMEAYKPFLAFDPRNKQDAFADYFVNNTNLTNAYLRRDSELRLGDFSLNIWGSQKQMCSDSTQTFVINPAIPSASYGYAPDIAIKSIRDFYTDYGKYLFTEYGFRSWINFNDNVISNGYDAFNQAAAVVMIENGRSGLIWDLFMGNEDIQRMVETHYTIHTEE